jgi:hypothetical protein
MAETRSESASRFRAGAMVEFAARPANVTVHLGSVFADGETATLEVQATLGFLRSRGRNSFGIAQRSLNPGQ